jgi:hypothetical protein
MVFCLAGKRAATGAFLLVASWQAEPAASPMARLTKARDPVFRTARKRMMPLNLAICIERTHVPLKQVNITCPWLRTVVQGKKLDINIHIGYTCLHSTIIEIPDCTSRQVVYRQSNSILSVRLEASHPFGKPLSRLPNH